MTKTTTLAIALFALASLTALDGANAALPGSRTMTEPAKSCNAGDDDIGMGGVDTGCKFRCDVDDKILLAIQSEDNEAWVQGKASCGGVTVECGGRQSCSKDSLVDNQERTSLAGVSEACRAESHETFGSYIQVECSARASAVPPVCDDCFDIPDWCPIKHVVCLPDTQPCAGLETDTIKEIDAGIVSFDAGDCSIGIDGVENGIVLQASGGYARGLQCIDWDCVSIMPTVTATAAGFIISV